MNDNKIGDGTAVQECEWFAMCENLTTKAAPHFVLGPVPCCDRCAKQVGIDNSIPLARS